MEHGASKCVGEQLPMEMTIKIEVEAAATSIGHIGSDIDLNHLKQEPGSVQSVKIEPGMSVKGEILEDGGQAATMEYGASESVKEHPQMELTIKTEVELEASYTTHIDSKIDLKRLKQEPELIQSVKGEAALLTKEEIPEDRSQYVGDQQCPRAASTPAGTGSANEACSMTLGSLLNVKQEAEDMEIGPTKLQRMDAHYTTNKIEKLKMDQNSQFEAELKRKKELANARLKKHRKRKREEAQKRKLVSQEEPNEQNNEQMRQNKLERQRELARECSRRYRDKKRICILKAVENAIYDSQIPGPSNRNPPLNPRTTIHNSQIPGTTINVDFSVINDEPGNVNDSEGKHAGPSQEENLVTQANQQSYLSPPDEENRRTNIDNNLALDQTPASSDPNSQLYRSSTTYSSYARHSSAHTEFHKQFTQNSFGHACKICDRLWFKNDLKNLNDGNVEFVRTFVPNIDEHGIAVCFTCRTSIQKRSIPKMAVYNGFKYPIIPDHLLNYPLDLVSERLVSPKIPFAQIRRLQRVQCQRGVYGQVINIPVEVHTTVDKLPRNIDDDHCVYVHMKRKQIHKSSFLRGLVNKKTIKEWLHYLVNTPLYRTYEITIDNQFVHHSYDDGLSFDAPSKSHKPDEIDCNDFTEDIPIDESLLAQQQTVIWNDDLYLRIAHGEANLLFDEHAEELSFPSIYLGQFRQFREGITVTPFMMATSELRRSDRRGVTPCHILYMAMKIMRMRVKDSLAVAFRHVGKDCNITKEEIQCEDFLRSIPNSSWYWSERKKDLFAMIRQLGKPTVFFTVSANEIGWPDLLQLLYRLNKRDYITKEAVTNLHFIVKSTLINEDPVTCVIYFNKLLKVIMNILQSKKCSPFRKFRVLHYFKHIEFQHQGSPRAHILAWLDNAPKDALNEDYTNAIELIDALTSVSASEASGCIKLQTHEHTFTCYKEITPNKAQKCRLEAPFMPSKKTMILRPMKETEQGFINYRKRYALIRARLENEDFVDIDEFYNRCGINSDEEYCNIIRAAITRPKVYVKREPSEKWHNPFNPFIFNIVKSKTDFQFITEEYSCAAYVVEYVNKTHREVSHFRRYIIEAMNESPEFDIVGITKNMSVNKLNQAEITTQEAAWYLLQEPMSTTSVTIVYIPTVWPVERRQIRKTVDEKRELEDDCIDVFKENWFDRYEKDQNTWSMLR